MLYTTYRTPKSAKRAEAFTIAIRWVAACCLQMLLSLSNLAESHSSPGLRTIDNGSSIRPSLSVAGICFWISVTPFQQAQQPLTDQSCDEGRVTNRTSTENGICTTNVSGERAGCGNSRHPNEKSLLLGILLVGFELDTSSPYPCPLLTLWFF